MTKKRKNKLVIRPWCWYCEREFEDEKVLMQHQKAKHYKCRHCPRKLNTAGGLAVHVQQVHKLDPEKIENALPGRDGGEVEIFGMEGVPKSDVEAWRRKKEIEAGVAIGSSAPHPKHPKLDRRSIPDEELAAQLEAHKALMRGSVDAAPSASGPTSSGTPIVYAAPQTYTALPTAAVPAPGAPAPAPASASAPAPGAPPFPGVPPLFVPPPNALAPGAAPPPGFPPFPPGNAATAGLPAFPSGWPSSPGSPPAPFAPSNPPGPGAAPLFVPGVSAPPPSLALQNSSSPAPAPGQPPAPVLAPPLPAFTPAASVTATANVPPVLEQSSPKAVVKLTQPQIKISYPPMKEGSSLVWDDANYSPMERRSQNPKYGFEQTRLPEEAPLDGGIRGTKRARAEDFL
ncbi:uncharacterized protein EI90DRAFT_3144199 [Cantharellus anzutake]|uniref:uncharacterized protein n=1 Tax=Cantharellus anzutake TaxID=1750568 RepID=UPI001905405E|nr:uncharacterized protein EI90DRAFT_3144199 [Cantharellus anzutake]KAF8338934.1 hypothetical protein EI90DRAFT_3144199 [Cantharellus anzutake]